jgi:hypothetical protein
LEFLAQWNFESASGAGVPLGGAGVGLGVALGVALVGAADVLVGLDGGSS